MVTKQLACIVSYAWEIFQCMCVTNIFITCRHVTHLEWVRLNRVCGWIVGGGSTVCLKIKKIYVSSLSAQSKFALGLRSCLFREFPVID